MSYYVILDADLSGSTNSTVAGKSVPERFFDIGIAEADMIGISAGFAASGYIPFASSFAMFSSGRAWEQIRNSIAYHGLNVKIIGSHDGISVGEDGVTHQAIEDIAIMRAMTGMSVYSPCDEWETKAVIRHVIEENGPCYIRLGRAKVDDVYTEDTVLDIHKIHTVRKGKDKIAVIATGLMVQTSIAAAKLLKEEGIDITVIDVCSIKPIDQDGITKVLKDNEIIFTAEDHSITGGLGTAVCEIACETTPRIIHRIGMYGFAGSGKWQELLHEYRLDGEGIAEQIKSYL